MGRHYGGRCLYVCMDLQLKHRNWSNVNSHDQQMKLALVPCAISEIPIMVELPTEL